MSFEVSPTQLLTICAVINGFVFSLLVLEKKENRNANRFLSLLIICMCLTFTPYMLDPSVWHKFRWLAWLPFSLTYWIGPTFYFYVSTLTTPGFKLNKKNVWHFFPIVLNYIHSVYHTFFPNSNPYPWFHHLAEILESVAILSILIYMVVSYQLVKKYQKSLLDQVSTLDLIDLGWIKKLIKIIVISFIFILVFLTVSSGIFGMESFSQWNSYRNFVLLVYSGILYWLSISGFRQVQTFKPTHSHVDNSHIKSKPSAIIEELKSILSDQKIYRNSELTLSDLSKSTGVSERSISETINQELGKNFYQFINEYRVEEVKLKLTDPKFDHLKIISLAIDSGFNSKASFNRVFKSFTRLSPKEFRLKSKNS